MYYLSVVEIFGKKSPIGTFYSEETGPKAVDLQETARFYVVVSTDSLDDFKKYMSQYTRDRLFSSASALPYEASIYQFDTLDEIQEILANLPQGQEVTLGETKKIEISSPKVAFAQSTIPEDIYEFEIEWN